MYCKTGPLAVNGVDFIVKPFLNVVDSTGSQVASIDSKSSVVRMPSPPERNSLVSVSNYN